MSDISNRIDKLLLDNKLRRSDLVRAINIGESTIRGWSTKVPSAEAAIKVAKYFNVSVEWLITGQEDIKENNSAAPEFSDQELELIKVFRSLSERDRDYLILSARLLVNSHDK